MAYNELIKNFNRIRDYMREFYIYGFKRRDEYTKKPCRLYNVRAGTFHSIEVTPDAQVLICENRDTCRGNTDYITL